MEFLEKLKPERTCATSIGLALFQKIRNEVMPIPTSRLRLATMMLRVDERIPCDQATQFSSATDDSSAFALRRFDIPREMRPAIVAVTTSHRSLLQQRAAFGRARTTHAFLRRYPDRQRSNADSDTS